MPRARNGSIYEGPRTTMDAKKSKLVGALRHTCRHGFPSNPAPEPEDADVIVDPKIKPCLAWARVCGGTADLRFHAMGLREGDEVVRGRW
jgi:hypothetical protein